MKSESGCVTHHYAKISDLFFVVDVWIIIWFCMLLQILFPVLFISRSSNLLALNFILFVSANLYSICKSFCSICMCPLHILFLEGFEYHRQSMILLRPQVLAAFDRVNHLGILYKLWSVGIGRFCPVYINRVSINPITASYGGWLSK